MKARIIYEDGSLAEVPVTETADVITIKIPPLSMELTWPAFVELDLKMTEDEAILGGYLS